MNKISGVYKITNNVTGDFYIGSSINVKQRWATHKTPSSWKKHSNSKLYQDMQKYGLDKFSFRILIATSPECLREAEQNCIELMRPTYNNRNAKGLDIERIKEYQKKYYWTENGKEAHKKARNKYSQTEKGKEVMKKGQRKYHQSDKCKEYQRKYRHSDKGHEVHKKAQKKYFQQLCVYNGETLTLGTLRARFRRAGIPHACIEAKKYLITDCTCCFVLFP